MKSNKTRDEIETPRITLLRAMTIWPILLATLLSKPDMERRLEHATETSITRVYPPC